MTIVWRWRTPRLSMEVLMAIAQTAGQDDDYAEHWQDYRHFVRTVQFMVAGIATILVLLAYFLL